MKKRVAITEKEAEAAALELAGLNVKKIHELVTLPAFKWVRYHEELGHDGQWERTPWPAFCEMVRGLLIACGGDLIEETVKFNVGVDTTHGECSVGYCSQFTTGRYIVVGEFDGEWYIEADTATGIPSTYFGEFVCMHEHLPELIAQDVDVDVEVL